MRIRHLLFGIVILLFTASCSTDPFSLFGKEDLLINSWLDPYESNCEGTDMFFIHSNNPYYDGERNRLDLWEDGSAKYVIGSPRDPHRYDFITSVTGSWIFDPGERTLKILDKNGKLRFTFQVHSVHSEELVLSYMENTVDDLPK